MLLMWLSLVVYLLTLWEAILEHRTAMRNMAQALQDEESQEESDQAMAEATERMRARQEQYRDKKAQDQANQERLAAEKRIAEAKDTVIKVRFNENNTNWT
jgi:predicted Holliday junction resolvase-like endonuclease